MLPLELPGRSKLSPKHFFHFLSFFLFSGLKTFFFYIWIHFMWNVLCDYQTKRSSFITISIKKIAHSGIYFIWIGHFLLEPSQNRYISSSFYSICFFRKALAEKKTEPLAVENIERPPETPQRSTLRFNGALKCKQYIYILQCFRMWLTSTEWILYREIAEENAWKKPVESKAKEEAEQMERTEIETELPFGTAGGRGCKFRTVACRNNSEHMYCLFGVGFVENMR